MKRKAWVDTSGEVRAWYEAYFTENETWPTSREYALRLLSRLVLPILPDRLPRLLDVGCGGGYFLATAEKQAETWGVDFSAAALREAAGRTASRLVVASADGLPFPDDCFDAITCLGALEHFLNPEAAAAEMRRVGTASCRYLILVPTNEAWIESDIQPTEIVGSNEEWSAFFIEQGFVVESVFETDRDRDLAAFSGGCAGLVLRAAREDADA